MRLRIAYIVIILLAFALRFHKLADVPLRGDEAFSALYWTGMPLSQSLRDIATIEPHPPLTYALFRFWGLFVGGIDSVFALRLLSALGNLLGVAAMYGLARRLCGRAWLSLMAALLWALHPFEIWHSQDYRNYALWAGFSVTALWLGLRLIQGRRALDWLLYGLAAGATALFFYAELFILIGFGLYGLLVARRDRGFVLRLLTLQALILAAAALAFMALQGDLLSSGEYGGNLAALDVTHVLTRFAPTLLLGESGGLPDWIWLPLALACAGLAFSLRKARRQIAFIALIGLLPIALLAVASLRVDVFDPRYVLASAPAWFLLLVFGCAGLARHRKLLTCLLLLPWLALSLLQLHAYYADGLHQKAPAWDELGAFLSRWVEEADLVIQLSADPAFGYYYRGAAPDIALPSSSRQPIDEIETTLHDAAATHRSLWLAAHAPAAWENAAAIDAWMQANMQLVLRSDASGLGIRQYLNRRIDAPDHAPLGRFGAAAELLDYRLFHAPLPTGELLLWLDWRLLKAADPALKSFAHLYDEAGDLRAQRDQMLGAVATAKGGEMFRDVLQIPVSSLAAHEYALRVGLYDPRTGARIEVNGADNLLLESFTLAATFPPFEWGN